MTGASSKVAGADLLYGLDAIAAHVGLTVPQVKWQITKSGWPTFKQGAKVCARKSALESHFAQASGRGRDRHMPTAGTGGATDGAGLLYGHRAIAAHLGLAAGDVTRLDAERRLPTYQDDGCTVASTAALDHWNSMKGGR